MGVQRSNMRRIWAVIVLVVIGAGLAAWEFLGPGSRVDAGLREAAVILTDTGAFPPVLYVEKGMDYRLTVTAATGRHSLTNWPGRSADGSAWVDPDTLARLDIPATQWRDGQPLGPGGPTVRIVDSLEALVARGEVYYVAVIAGADGLVPRQVRLTEGLKAAVGGVSPDGQRTLLIEGARLYLPVSPGAVTELLVDVPGPGVYNVVCEQGCEDGRNRWQGSFRVEDSNNEVPWVEARDTDASADLHSRAPDFILYDDAGRTVQLSDFQGEKPVFINFWATWCPPCRREMPEMQELYALRGDQFEILAVNYLENRSQVTAFFEELELGFPALMDVSGDVNSRYGVWSYPTSIFVDRNGIVRGRFIGALSLELMEEFIDVITK